MISQNSLRRLWTLVVLMVSLYIVLTSRAGELGSAAQTEQANTPQVALSVSLPQPNTFHERPLLDYAREGNAQIYRFSCFLSFGPPVAVRLEVNAAGRGVIFLKQLISQRSPEIRSRRYKVATDDVERLLTLIASFDFWDMAPAIPEPPDTDGSTWLLEGTRNGVFHAVSRSSPEEGAFHDAMLFFLKLAGLDACGAYGVLGQYELTRLSYLGSIITDEPPKRIGLVKTPDGLLEKVRLGEGLGAHFGQATEITEEYIEATEVLQDGPGAWIEKATRLYRSPSEAVITWSAEPSARGR